MVHYFLWILKYMGCCLDKVLPEPKKRRMSEIIRREVEELPRRKTKSLDLPRQPHFVT
jgi:hypothetical protein